MKNLVFVLLSVCSVADASWISSGGGLFRDAFNPWFVRNTKNVNYCVRVDSATFSAKEGDVRQALKEGIEYWKTEFGRVAEKPKNGFFDVGTQNFVEVDCGASSVDIEFLFGYGTLSEERIKYLQAPAKYVGVSVRTDYDEANLRGKGFVFFSSDSGPQAYDNPGSLVTNAWQRPKILKYALLHELGHIFGIPHMGSGLMSEVFLNQILNKSLVHLYEQAPIESFLHPAESVQSCVGFFSGSQADAWLGKDAKQKCIEIQSKTTPWKVFASETETSTRTEIGEIRTIQPDILSFQSKPVTILQLTSLQTVFAPIETAFRSFMVGPVASQFQAKAVYAAKNNSSPKPINITVGPSYLSIVGSVNNKLETIFTYNSPISVQLMLEPTP